ncbi:MAG: ATP-binding protein, partial [Pseudomonadota bacterium]|nr:ATP-binding protein [Pseudomonadota bacterium]
YVEAARRATERAAALTHRLLAFARRQALDPKPADIDKLVLGMEELIHRTTGPGIVVELRMGRGTWTAQCDANQLENALLNLVINARDAMPEGGRLTISTEQLRLSEVGVAGEQDVAAGDFVAVAVGDTGIGMPPDVMEHAFEPFFTTKPTGQGTGLGLSQIYGFVRQLGGFVRLESAPGRGTIVRLLLPRSEPAREEEEQQADGGQPEAAESGETVLLVEDETMTRELAADGLRELGYRVLEAEDGGSALRLLDSGAHLDLLVTDVGLPGGLNGRQLAEVARRGRPSLGVLFVTGYAGDAFQDQLSPGMEVIAKPFRLDVLAARIRAMLGTAVSAPRALAH